MNLRLSHLACLGTILILPTAALAQINGFTTNSRVTNGWPNSTLVITNPGTNPDNVTLNESAFGTGAGVNRHDILASSDGGLTNASLPSTSGFQIQGTFQLTDGSNAPRKETGIRVNIPTINDSALFIVNSDAGEIVAFGGGAPFYSFRAAPFNETAYVPGQTITLGEIYTPKLGANPATIEYYINRGSGVESSGKLPFTNVEQAWAGSYSFGVYEQGAPANTGGVADPTDFVHVNITNLSASVPEPATIGLASLGAMALLASRRRR